MLLSNITYGIIVDLFKQLKKYLETKEKTQAFPKHL